MILVLSVGLNRMGEVLPEGAFGESGDAVVLLINPECDRMMLAPEPAGGSGSSAKRILEAAGEAFREATRVAGRMEDRRDAGIALPTLGSSDRPRVPSSVAGKSTTLPRGEPAGVCSAEDAASSLPSWSPDLPLDPRPVLNNARRTESLRRPDRFGTSEGTMWCFLLPLPCGEVDRGSLVGLGGSSMTTVGVCPPSVPLLFPSLSASVIGSSFHSPSSVFPVAGRCGCFSTFRPNSFAPEKAL